MDMQLIFCNFNKVVFTKGKTEMECFWVEMIRPLKSEEVRDWKIRFHDYSSFECKLAQADKRKRFNFLETISLGDFIETVPQTDTGGLVEYTKASERTFLKELGNTTGRTFGRCPPLTFVLLTLINNFYL